MTQEQIRLGATNLASPLMTIINESIPTSTFPDGNVCHQFLKFPDAWKETGVTLVLKKGDNAVKENYRPVSCLLASLQAT